MSLFDLPLSLVGGFVQAFEDLAAQAKPASDGAIATMRQIAELAGQDLDAVAADLGVELVGATMYDLQCIGRALGRSMGLKCVSVG